MVKLNALNTLNSFYFLLFVVVVISERMNTIIMQKEVFAPLRMRIPEKLFQTICKLKTHNYHRDSPLYSVNNIRRLLIGRFCMENFTRKSEHCDWLNEIT